MLRTTILTSLAATLLVPTAVSAASITGWNTDNVAVPAVPPPPDVTGESVNFDRESTAAGAVTNGKVVYTPPEGVPPGVTVENGAFTFGPASATATGCIRASAPRRRPPAMQSARPSSASSRLQRVSARSTLSLTSTPTERRTPKETSMSVTVSSTA